MHKRSEEERAVEAKARKVSALTMELEAALILQDDTAIKEVRESLLEHYRGYIDSHIEVFMLRDKDGST